MPLKSRPALAGPGEGLRQLPTGVSGPWLYCKSVDHSLELELTRA